jgi:multisubunit Na+/H+ antiporter MnhB subunit
MILVFDALLGLGLVLAALGALWSRSLFRGVVLFVVFGLLVAIAWVRLDAPDVALAEAAIGAGLTGALLLDAVGHLRRARARDEPSVTHAASHEGPPVPGTRVALGALLGAGLGITLVAAVRARTLPDINLAAQVADALPQSGVEHAITAVLLQFRSYDTLLEIAVLLAAAIVALALRTPATSASTPSADGAARAIDTPVLSSLTRTLHPTLLLLAGYLLWAGATRPGGAFQAGAVLAALGVLRRVSGEAPFAAAIERVSHGALLAGFATFLAFAVGMLALGRTLLSWPPETAGAVILVIEAVLTVSIAVSLVGLFASAPAAHADGAPRA